jgi:hypothetical protein
MKAVFGTFVALFVATTLAGAQEVVPTDPLSVPAPQPRERRPYRGLFGGDEARGGTPGLTATASAFGGYDDNVIAGQQGADVNRQNLGGKYAGATGQLTYLVVRRRSAFTAQGSSELRYYNADGQWQQMSHAANVGLTLPVGRLNELSIRQGFRYSPYYQLDVAPDLPGLTSPDVLEQPPVDVDQSLTALQSRRLDSNVRFQQPVGRGAMRYMYGFRTARFDDETMDSTSQNASVGYSRRVSRYATMRLGYGYQNVRHLNTERGDLTLHDIDLGWGYSRPLSFSRRTTVGFSAGSGIATTATRNHYRIIADATAHHEIGRTWLLRGAYRQGLQVVELYPEPLFGYTVRGTLSGLPGTRSELAIDASSSSGSFDSAQASGGYGSYQGSARFRHALTRTIAAYVQYSYYKYTVADTATLPQPAAQPFERHGLSFGLTLWLPISVSRQTDGAR